MADILREMVETYLDDYGLAKGLSLDAREKYLDGRVKNIREVLETADRMFFERHPEPPKEDKGYEEWRTARETYEKEILQKLLPVPSGD